MKKLSIYFLAFLTLWMSTWMVTDIHDVSIVNNESMHQLTSVQHSHAAIDHQVTTDTHEHDSHCGVCSYDHGGHIGQTLATSPFVAERIPVQNTLNYPLQADLWYSRNTTPNIRPPIA